MKFALFILPFTLCIAAAFAADPSIREVPVTSPNPAVDPLGYSASTINTVAICRNIVVTAGDIQFVTYYGGDKKIRIARRTLGKTDWQCDTTAFTANDINDDHDTISIAIDGDGFLHMSWGMHGNPFRYARSAEPVRDLATPIRFDGETPMTGKESGVTYPEFVNLPDGRLIYFFRSGGSGDGNSLANVYDTKTRTWTRVADPMISGRCPGHVSVNAYPHTVLFDQHRRLVWTWTWRTGEDSLTGQKGYQTNHNLMYARSTPADSPDFLKTWTKHDGTPYAGVIDENNAEIIREIPEGSSLINNAGMWLDGNGDPVIVTWMAPSAAAGDHRRQYVCVYRDGSEWKSSTLTDFKDSAVQKAERDVRDLARPIVVVDDSGRTIAVFRARERGNKLTAAWSTDRVHWQLVDLLDEDLGQYEPAFDQPLWVSQKKFHLFVQATQRQKKDSPPTAVRIVEWDLDAFFKTHK